MGLSVLGSIYFMYKAFTHNKRYETSEEEDEVVDELYKTTFRSLEYATILYNIATGLALFNMIFSIKFSDYSITAGFDFLAILLFLPLQVAIFKVTQAIRQYKLSAFPTPDEVRDYMYSLDEGEKQANFEQSFLTIFNLNQWILPLLYVVVAMVTMISSQQQLLALIIVAFIHIYINAMQYKMVRRYFK